MSRHPMSSTLFPYTTLFRSVLDRLVEVQLVEQVSREGDRCLDRSHRAVGGMVDPAQVLRQPGPDGAGRREVGVGRGDRDRKSTRLNSSHRCISYAVFCLKKK